MLKKHIGRNPSAVKARIVTVPSFGPEGCDSEAWGDYARHARIAFEAGNGEATVGAWSVASPLRHVKKRPRTAEQLQAALAHPNTRVVNVQAPWGQLISEGVKDIENRPDEFPKSGGWMVIVSSKTNFSRPEWDHRNADIERRLAWAGVADKIAYSQEHVRADDQHAIAVVKVTSLNNSTAALQAKQSIWNNGDAFAWKIDEVHKLPCPVFYGNGSLGKPYFKNCSCAFKQQVRHQLMRCASSVEEVECERVLAAIVRQLETTPVARGLA